MAHKIGLNDTLYEPDIISGAVDFSFFEDDNDVARTKGESSDIVKSNSSVLVSSSSPSSSPPYRLGLYQHHQHHHPSVNTESSSPSSLVQAFGAKCFVESRSPKDISCGLTKGEEEEREEDGEEEENRRRRRRSSTSTKRTSTRRQRRPQTEGHLGSGEAMRNEDRASFGSSSSERETVGSASSFEAHELHAPRTTNSSLVEASGAVMEQVDPIPSMYSSDEWEASDLSDTDEDHSDSSDDDDPKSQVDRLIERGTLMYMDGENSNLSSETESSDSSDYDDSDSESDITDVSPLISATASPLGLSPVLPRRTLGTSPLALHDNRYLEVVDYRPEISSNDQGYDSQPHCNGSSHSNSDDSTDMTLLLKAVVELEKKQNRKQNNHQNNRPSDHYNSRRYPHHHHKNRQNSRHHQNHPHPQLSNHHTQDLPINNHHHHNPLEGSEPTSPITIHPIDASPHHSHLRKASHSLRRKNMSFSNDEVRRIDRENQILLHKIMNAHTRSSSNKSQSSSNHNNTTSTRSVHRPANSTVNRRREEEKIRRENMILLRKIQEAKPSRDVTTSRSPRHKDNGQHPSNI